MDFNVSRFKVVYKERVLNAVSARAIFTEGEYPEPGKTVKPKGLEVCAINADGNIVFIIDEAWMFQFVPIIQKGVAG